MHLWYIYTCSVVCCCITSNQKKKKKMEEEEEEEEGNPRNHTQPEAHNRVSCVQRPAGSLLHRSNGILRQCIGTRCVCSGRVCTIYDPSSTLTPSTCAVLLCTPSRQPSNLLSRHGAQCYVLQADTKVCHVSARIVELLTTFCELFLKILGV